MDYFRTFRFTTFLTLLLLGGTLLAECNNAARGSHFASLEPLDGEAVTREIQHNLKNINLFKGEIDGKGSEELTKAIKAFQKSSRMHPDGEISDPLRIKLLGKEALQANTLYAEAAQGKFSRSIEFMATDPLLNARDGLGWTPLLYAVLYGKKRAVSQLLKAGAKVDMASLYGTTPVMTAVYMNWPGILKQLLKQWPNLDQTNYRDEVAEGIAFTLKANRMLGQFRRHRQTMARSKMRRIPPFKIRMITWDKQECYRATTARLDVTCQVEHNCKQRINTLRLCNDRAEKYIDRIAGVVRKMWGGETQVIREAQPTDNGPFNCQKDDVLLLGVK